LESLLLIASPDDDKIAPPDMGGLKLSQRIVSEGSSPDDRSVLNSTKICKIDFSYSGPVGAEQSTLGVLQENTCNFYIMHQKPSQKIVFSWPKFNGFVSSLFFP
jgi:hypothetical protein